MEHSYTRRPKERSVTAIPVVRLQETSTKTHNYGSLSETTSNNWNASGTKKNYLTWLNRTICVVEHTTIGNLEHLNVQENEKLWKAKLTIPLCVHAFINGISQNYPCARLHSSAKMQNYSNIETLLSAWKRKRQEQPFKINAELLSIIRE